MGHISFKTLLIFAELGIIPRHLAKTKKMPLCASCIVAHAHKRPWHNNSGLLSIQKEEHDFTGGCVSVDQIISGHNVMVTQTSGFSTLEQFVGATVFLDNFSNFTLVCMIHRINTMETMDAKAAFERKANEYGVKILNY